MMWKEWAWDGIRFLAPAGWDIAKLRPGHMLLEDESGPVMEVRSRPIKGVFSPKDQLRHLRSSQDKQLRKGIREVSLEKAWREVLKSYKSLGFLWKGESLQGKGLILYCPICGRATALQFFERRNHDLEEVTPLRILDSFQDHRKDGCVLWAVFDIRALIPDTYRLTGHRFNAGEFEIVFSRKGQKISMHRWGPASVLIPEGNLSSLVERLSYLRSREFRRIPVAGMHGLEWKEEPRSTFLGRLWQRVNMKSSLKWFRLWHVRDKNRILGVGFEGGRNIEPSVFEQICASYECI